MRDLLLLVTTFVLVFAPGLVVGWFLRLRGALLAIAAPALTFPIAAAGGQWLRLLGVPWGVFTAAAVFALATGTAWVLVRRLARGSDRVVELAERTPLWSWAGPIAGSVLALVMVGRGIGWDLSNVNQSWDPPWHANLVSYIASTGLGDWTATRNNQLGWDGQFYPTGLHVVQSLVYQLTDQDAARVFNAFLVVSALLIPWALFLLVRTVAPRWPAAAALVGLIAVVPVHQPWVQIGTQAWSWSMTLMPAAVALAMTAASRPGWLAVPSAGLALAATLALQPAGFASALVLLACWLAAGPVGGRARAAALGRLAAMGGLTAVVLAPMLYAGSRAVDDVSAFFATPTGGLLPSIRDTFLLQVDGLVGAQVALVAFAAVGFGFAAWRRDLRWAALAFVVTAGLNVIALAAPEQIRSGVTGIWYSDASRLARLQESMTVVLVALGVVALVLAAGRLSRPAVRRLAMAAVPLVLLAGLGVQYGTVAAGVNVLELAYDEHPGGPSITDQQVAVLRAAAPLFGPDENVVVDSWQGGIWLHALTGVRAVVGRYGDPDAYEPDLLLRHIDEIDTNREVQEVVVANKVCGIYVGTGSVVPRGWTWSGFAELATARAFTRVYEDEDSQVYVLRGELADRAGCRSAGAGVVRLPATIAAAG